MPAPSGPGRYRAINATTCLYPVGFQPGRYAAAPADSTEDAGGVAGAHELKDLHSSAESLPLMSMPKFFLMFALALEITVSVRRPSVLHFEQAHVGNGMARTG